MAGLCVCAAVTVSTDKNALQEWYAIIKDQQFRLAGALRRMQNRQVSMAWEKWQVTYSCMNSGYSVPHLLCRNGMQYTWTSNGSSPVG